MSDAEDSDSIVNEFVTAIVRESDKFAKVHSYPMQYGTGGYRAEYVDKKRNLLLV